MSADAHSPTATSPIVTRFSTFGVSRVRSHARDPDTPAAADIAPIMH
jgi:hypothetical protein